MKPNLKTVSETDDNIPTLEIQVPPLDEQDIKLEAMVHHLAQDLQATLHQHLYQAMVKTMHQVVNQESERLSVQILEKLHEQLPEIIESACRESSKK